MPSFEADYVNADGNFNDSIGILTGGQNVQYNVCPLIQQNPPFAVTSGATFPIKMYLCDASGNDVSSSSIIVHTTGIAPLTAGTGTLDDAGNANPDNDFRFDRTLGPSGGYIFNLKTTGLQSGTWAMYFGAGYNPNTGQYSDPAGGAGHSIQFGVK